MSPCIVQELFLLQYCTRNLHILQPRNTPIIQRSTRMCHHILGCLSTTTRYLPDRTNDTSNRKKRSEMVYMDLVYLITIMFNANANAIRKASSFGIKTFHAQKFTSTTKRYLSNANEIDLFRPYFPIFYNDVYEVPLPPNHRFPMEKYRKVRERVQYLINSFPKDESQQVRCDFRVSPLVTVEDLHTTHCAEYVERYLEGNQTEEEIRNVGFPWSKKSVDRAFSSTGGTVAAAVSICEEIRHREEMKRSNLNNDNDRSGHLWSAHLAGGTHHAFKDRGEGFCVFSDIAVATNVILRDFADVVQRVLIVDLDVHQGNGNAVLFQGVDEVVTFSMHCDANYFSEKQNSDLDIELPHGCGDETYLATLNHWVNRVRRGDAGKIDFIFFQAGVDILEDDRLGRLSVTQEGVSRRNKMVFDLAHDLGCPLCITMGGGYPRTDWEPILEAHANVYFEAYKYLAKFNEFH